MTAPNIALARRIPHIKWTGVVFLLLGLALGVFLISATKTIYQFQGGVSQLSSLIPLGYAFSAGMVATVNPCGILLLPSLVAYYLGRDDGEPLPAWQRAGKGLIFGAMATLGFVSLFAVVGLIIGSGGRALATAFPVSGLAVGVGLALLGAWLALTGRGFGLLMASQAMGHVRLGRDLRSLFLFGVGYAVTSLACTLPIFLVVAASALASGGPLAAAGQFVSYALGMGSVLTAFIVGAAFFQGAVTHWAREIVPHIHRLAAAFLIGAGLFVANYWLTTGGFLSN